MIRQHQRRHQYLEAMGISSWLPRNVLPGAKPTPAWVWEFVYPEPVDPDAAVVDAKAASQPTGASRQSVPTAVTAAAARQARADLAASFAGLADNKSPPPAVTSPIAASTAVVDAVEHPARTVAQAVTEHPSPVPAIGRVQRDTPAADVSPDESSTVAIPRPDTQAAQAPFKLAFISYADCLVIDALPPQSRQGVSTQHQVLLGKILQSMGLQGGDPVELFMLPWPMFASKSLDQGAEQARSTVQHKLSRSLQVTPVRYVLLLGEAAAQLVLERAESLDALRGLVFSLRADVKALASASLTEMMTVPGCKRDVWQDLQPLLRQLEGRATG